MSLHQTIIDWFCLINSNGIGPKTFWSMLQTHKSAEESLKYVHDPFPRKTAEKILSSSKGGHIILASDPLFPAEFKRSALCPPMLFAMGNTDLLNNKKIAIVGARNASLPGKEIASKMAFDLSNHFSIVSGMANGIDTAAHLGSLKNNASIGTIAVLPFSFQNIYPRENANLFDQIIKSGGLAITEVPPHRPPDQGMFIARNRILSLLSIGIVVIEASLRSGTLSTAKLALDFGTEVMVVPGSPLDQRSKGSNHLIKNGAPLVEDYCDVLEILGYSSHTQGYKSQKAQQTLKLNEENSCKYSASNVNDQIISMLSVDLPISIDLIARNLNIDINLLLSNISELEITGKIRKCSTNEVILNG